MEGHFWLTGNPAALADEVRDEAAAFEVRHGALDGDYRRGGEPGSARALRLSGVGWRPLEGGAMVGRVVADRESLDRVAAVSTQRYGSSPFNAVDSAGHTAVNMVARIEGAAGWRLGRVSVGVGAGYEAGEFSTVRSVAPRFGRAAAPGASAGVLVALGPAAVGAYGRFSTFAETSQIVAVAGPGLVYTVHGYDEPVRHPVSGSAGNYFLRIEHDARAAGLNLGTRTAGIDVYGFIEAAALRERRWNDRSTDRPPPHRWSPDGWAAGAALAARPGAATLAAEGRWERLSGQARRAGEAVHFLAEEWRVSGSLRGDWRPTGSPWELVAVIGAAFDSRARRDTAAQLATDLASLHTDVGLTVGRRLTDATFIAAGAGFSGYQVRGTIPRENELGPDFRAVLAPDIALRATDGRTWSVALQLRQELTGGAAAFAAFETGATNPAGFKVPPSRPGGSRSTTALRAGITLRPQH